MPDRDVKTIRELIYCQYATIIAKSAFAVSDGESRLKHRGTRSSMTPSAASPLCRCHNCSGTRDTGDLDGVERQPSSISIGCWMKGGA